MPLFKETLPQPVFFIPNVPWSSFEIEGTNGSKTTESMDTAFTDKYKTVPARSLSFFTAFHGSFWLKYLLHSRANSIITSSALLSSTSSIKAPTSPLSASIFASNTLSALFSFPKDGTLESKLFFTNVSVRCTKLPNVSERSLFTFT